MQMDRSASALEAACAAFCASLRGERSWRNVQPILLTSFTSVAQLLTAQAQQIEALHQQLASLQAAVDVSEERVEALVSGRVTQALEPFRQQLVDDSAQQQHAMVTRVLSQVQERYATKEDADLAAAAQLSSLKQREDVLALQIQQLVTGWKSEMESEWRQSQAKQYEAQAEHQHEQLERMKLVIERDLKEKLESHRHEDLCASSCHAKSSVLKTEQDPEQDTDDFAEEALRHVSSNELQAIEARLSQQLIAWRQELTLSINKKSCQSEVTKLLSRKLDSAQLDEVSSKLVDMIESAQETMAGELKQMRQLGISKAEAHNTAQLKQNLHELLCVVESLQHESSGLRAAMSQKVSVEDAKQLIDSRSTLVGLEQTMQKMESAIASDFSTKRDLQGVAQQVLSIKQLLRSEMYQARYIWKDGRPSPQQTIAWSTQVVNTNADVFIWKAGSDRVMLKIPGLYHLQAAFFTDFAPTITVLINGEPGLVLAGDDEAAVIEPSSSTSGKLGVLGALGRSNGFQRVHHSAGNVVGLAIDAFLALPARAVVQVSYDIDEKAQGFLNLRKL
ncbi:hypothetical protein Gpo141_00004322 [Globisporangium polare]